MSLKEKVTLYKELEEAGFPQEGDGHGSNRGTKDGEVFYYPTLSELIEACGEGFQSLENKKGKVVLGITEDWVVSYRTPSGGGATFGKSPEEAVAKSWLALQNNES